MSEDRKQVSRAVAWVGMASSVVALLDVLALGVLLAFWVTRADLGEATYAVTLFYFLDLATEAGLSSVLIQRPTLDRDTIDTVFWLNVGVSCALFAAMFGIGPLIGALQDHPRVGTMLILYATKLVYQNVYFVPAALLRRELRFKELSIVRTLANFGDVAGRVGFAAAGEPVWCFVAGPLIRIAITGIGLQICHPWRPRLVFVRGHVREWLAYAGKTSGSQMLQHLYNNIGYQIVGAFFGAAILGTYRVAYEMVLYPVNFVSNIVAQVAFPAFARLARDRDALAAQFRRFTRQNAAMTLPILVLIAVASNDLLAVLFPKETDGETVARLLCVVGMLRAVDCLYLPLLDAVGMPGRNVLIAAIAVGVLTGCDVVFSALLKDVVGVDAVAWGRMVGYPLVISLHAYFALSQMGLSGWTYVRDLGGIVLCGAIAAVPGVALEVFAPGLAPGVRLIAVVVVTLVGVATTLHYLQGLGPKAIVDELRKKR